MVHYQLTAANEIKFPSLMPHEYNLIQKFSKQFYASHKNFYPVMIIAEPEYTKNTRGTW